MRIYSRLNESCYDLIVEDQGIGFDEKYAERIFMPFQRLHSRRVYEGTGMGLAICHKIVMRHRGTIKAESALGHGSAFILIPPKTVTVRKWYLLNKSRCIKLS
ncbi:MAG TPA: ATP-binding protein [Thermodesulfovibrionia bacterium]|nr:ATP-binding protein [Thermodesulfovibrionia bacterium]